MGSCGVLDGLMGDLVHGCLGPGGRISRVGWPIWHRSTRSRGSRSGAFGDSRVRLRRRGPGEDSTGRRAVARRFCYTPRGYPNEGTESRSAPGCARVNLLSRAGSPSDVLTANGARPCGGACDGGTYTGGLQWPIRTGEVVRRWRVRDAYAREGGPQPPRNGCEPPVGPIDLPLQSLDVSSAEWRAELLKAFAIRGAGYG